MIAATGGESPQQTRPCFRDRYAFCIMVTLFYFSIRNFGKEEGSRRRQSWAEGRRKIAKGGSEYFRRLQAKPRNRKGSRPPKSKKTR